jgi:hypothetical protein
VCEVRRRRDGSLLHGHCLPRGKGSVLLCRSVCLFTTRFRSLTIDHPLLSRGAGLRQVPSSLVRPLQKDEARLGKTRTSSTFLLDCCRSRVGQIGEKDGIIFLPRLFLPCKRWRLCGTVVRGCPCWVPPRLCGCWGAALDLLSCAVWFKVSPKSMRNSCLLLLLLLLFGVRSAKCWHARTVCSICSVQPNSR